MIILYCASEGVTFFGSLDDLGKFAPGLADNVWHLEYINST